MADVQVNARKKKGLKESSKIPHFVENRLGQTLNPQYPTNCRNKATVPLPVVHFVEHNSIINQECTYISTCEAL